MASACMDSNSEAISYALNELASVSSLPSLDKVSSHNALKLIEKVSALIKSLKRDNGQFDWFYGLNETLLQLAEKTAEKCPKINRKLIQAFLESEKLNPSAAEASLVAMETTSSMAQIILWSCMIDQSQGCMKFIRNNLYDVLGVIHSQLQALKDLHLTLELQKHLHILAKFSLQLFQHLPDRIAEKFSTNNGKKAIDLIFQHLLSILKNPISPKDVCLLASTSICFLIKSVSETPIKESAFLVKLFFNLYGVNHLDSSNPEVTCTQPDLSFGHLSLLNGILSCADIHLLCTETPSGGPLYAWLFTQMSSMLHLSEHHYHTFNFFASWFAKISRNLQVIHSTRQVRIFHPDDQLWSLAFHVIWNYLESPVEGVTECISSCFKSFLIIITKEAEFFNTSDPSGDLLCKVMLLSWQLKGKHLLLACLLEHCQISDVFAVDSSMMNEMRGCLSTNYLASPSSDLYLAMLKKMKLTDNALNDWKIHCMDCIVSSLKSTDSLIRHNVTHFWIPLTLTHLPRSLDLLLLELQGHDEGIMALLRVARSQKLLSKLPVDLLGHSLQSNDTNVRRDAFTLICNSPKKSEVLSDDEIDLLMTFLPLNLSHDCAPFRQQLQNNIHSAIVRARDSTLSLHKSAKKSKEKTLSVQAVKQIEFVAWLWKLSLQNLQPSSNFQRVKTCITHLRILLDGLLYNETRRGRKSGCPASAREFYEIGQNLGKLDFFTKESSLVLLSCLLHGADEIREQASGILLDFFPFPFPSSPTEDLLNKGLSLANSCHAREAQSGAAILSLIFSKAVIQKQNEITFCMEDSNWKINVTEYTEKSPHLYIESLLKHLQLSLNNAEENVLNAAKFLPSHGFILASQLCLKSLNFCDLSWQSVLADLIQAVLKSIDNALAVFGKNPEHPEIAPSFEQMSDSIERVIHNCHKHGVSLSDGQSQGSTALSLEHQLLSTWCWLNIRESSILLGSIVSTIPPSAKDLTLSLDEIKSIGQTFITVLTSCRHRGAIEGCSLGFIAFCSHLLACSMPELCSIPSELLHQVLNKVISSSEGSVTRRSAGLPLIVQSILASESHTRQTRLLQHCVNSLLVTISSPVAASLNQQLDLAPVHAMHILKAIIQEASISHAVLPYIGKSAEVALNGLSSPHWAIRNAATQLFGSLLTRMLGQKKTSECMTAQEFYTMHPSLWTSLIVLLKESNTSLHPSLFPALTILSRLSPGFVSSEVREQLNEVHQALSPLARSPMMAVRHLASEAIVSLVPQEETSTFASKLFTAIESYRKDTNALYGALCQIRLLCLQTHISTNDTTLIAGAFIKAKWILEPEICALVRCIYIRIAEILYQKCAKEIEALVRDVMNEVLNEDIRSIGSDQLRSAAITLWLKCGTEDQLRSRLELSIHSHYKENRDAALSWIQSTDVPSNVYSMLLDLWIKSNLKETDILETLIGCDSQLTHSTMPGADVFKFIMSDVSEDDYWESAFTKIAAHFVSEACTSDEFHLLVKWSEMVAMFSDPLSNDICRSHAASALSIAGKKFSNWAFTSNNTSVIQPILQSIVRLLFDENEDIRLVIQDYLMKTLSSNQQLSLINRLFIEIFPHLIGRKNGVEVLWDLLTSDNCALPVDASTERWQEVFAAQELNPYYEQWVVSSAVLQALKESSSIHADVSQWIAQELPAIEKNLSKNIEFIAQYKEGKLLNASFDKSLFFALLSSAHQLIFVLLLQPQTSSRQSIQSLLVLFNQVSSVHPALSDVFNKIQLLL